MADRVLIVDGHSVVHRWDDLLALHGRAPAAAREELVRRLGDLQDMTDWHVVVVFDGRGERVSEDHVPDGLQVFYSDTARSADHVIERLTVRYRHKYRLCVASDDRLVRHNCAASGAETVGTQSLREMLEEAGRLYRQAKARHFR